MSKTLERFASVAYAALCEAGHPDIIVPAFEHDGVPYLEFDTDDYPEGSDEFRCLMGAEELALASVSYPQATATPENVECPECDALVEEAMQWRDWQSLDMGVYCDKHTPENVEQPFDEHTRMWAEEIIDPPENVDSPTTPTER